MKALRSLAVALVALLGLSLHAAAATSYPLRVRGGESLRFSTEPSGSTGLVKLTVEFGAGTRPATDGLRPGNGSWMDRGMRTGEPAKVMCFVLERDVDQIAEYLRSPSHYYTFECFNTGRGYLQATRQYVKTGRID
jgi:hypothetical protein